jgi:hypothetical protein
VTSAEFLCPAIEVIVTETATSALVNDQGFVAIFI